MYYELTTNEDGTEWFEAKDPTTVEMWTPHVLIVNSGDGSQDSSDEDASDEDSSDEEEEIPEEDLPLVEIPEEDSPLVEIPEEDVPLSEIPDEEVPLVDMIDEEVPLAEVPKTGDSSALWLMLSALSGTGLAGFAFLGRKKREEI